MSKIKGYRTFIIGASVVLLGAAETLNWTDIVTEQNAGVIVAAIGGVIGVLRAFTTTAPGKSD